MLHWFYVSKPIVDMKSGKVVGTAVPISDAAVACQKKMMQAHVGLSCQKTFLENLRVLEGGESTLIPEDSILPVTNIIDLSQIDSCIDNPQKFLKRLVILKLNGGLGTGMGLNTPKSLLEIKNKQTIMDFIVHHIMWLQKLHGISLKNCSCQASATTSRKVVSSSMNLGNGTAASPITTSTATATTHMEQFSLRFMLMNSFKTSAPTKEYLSMKYPHFFSAASLHHRVELMQNQVPKILQNSFLPVEWPPNPTLEWVPPGHGDIYCALYETSMLDKLTDEGFEYLFISNSDNLGGTVDLRILQWMDAKNIPFIMEVCQRNKGDRKGGHLARLKENPSQFILRESCQCSPDEINHFQDIQRHQYFNTNNIWVHLPTLKKKMMAMNGNIFRLPVLQNRKTVDPNIPSSPKVFQLETALGAAISLFPDAAAIVVPRDRFIPVKSCADLLVVRSDAYLVTPDEKLVLNPKCNGSPPIVLLDDYYQLLKHFEELIPYGVPSLVGCTRLSINGKAQFGGGSGIILQGDVTIENPDGLASTLVIPNGITLKNTTYRGA